MDVSGADSDDRGMLPCRTDGDGMEVGRPNTNTHPHPHSRVKRYSKSSGGHEHGPPHTTVIQHTRSQFSERQPRGPLHRLKPKLVQPSKSNTMSSFSYGYGKEPRFIPREPFKGAVTPMISSLAATKKFRKQKVASKNNVDIQVLVSQMSHLASTEFKHNLEKQSTDKDAVAGDGAGDGGRDPKELFEENQRLENDVRTLRDTNEQLEKQLRFQTQVNSELKTLLVAAVGEDLEARVQLLTEDKLQLARALLSSAQNLSTHREQVEWLAGHSEVWRSKFLASSLMVDELARWKSILTSHLSELQESVKCLLEEHNQLDQMAFNTHNLLRTITSAQLDSLSTAAARRAGEDTEAMHVMDLIASCGQMAESLALHFDCNKNTNVGGVRRSCTPGERVAQQALTRINSIETANSTMYKLLLNKSTCTSTTSPSSVAAAPAGDGEQCHHCSNKQ